MVRLAPLLPGMLLLAFAAIAHAAHPASAPLRLEIGGGVIDAQVPAEAMGVSQADVRTWLETAANAVSTYFGHYPVHHVVIEVIPTDDGGVHGGTTYDGRFIRIHLGRDTKAADLSDDWMLTHEMFHLGFPDLDPKYLWMNEGLSDYLEPLARARIGNLTPEKAWLGFVEGMPQGQPERGDRGLDNTHTWGRTYWGGCVFWLLADVRIRQKTQSRHSLDDAIQSILAGGGDGSRTWPLARVLDVGDKATGTTVLHDLHAQYGEQPAPFDLDALWKQLGVQYHHGVVTFDDRAPLAEIRKSMTQKKG